MSNNDSNYDLASFDLTSVIPFAKTVAGKRMNLISVKARYEYDDLVNELLFRMASKIDRYDPSKGSKVSSYAMYLINCAAGEVTRECDAKGKHEQKMGLVSIDSLSAGMAEDGGRSDALHPSYEDDRSAELLECLTDQEKDIILRRASGQTLAEIGSEYGVSGQTIHNWAEVAKAKIQQA